MSYFPPAIDRVVSERFLRIGRNKSPFFFPETVPLMSMAMTGIAAQSH